MSAPIVTCPYCGRDVISRERRPNGVHKCAGGHLFTPSQVPPPEPEPQERTS